MAHKAFFRLVLFGAGMSICNVSLAHGFRIEGVLHVKSGDGIQHPSIGYSVSVTNCGWIIRRSSGHNLNGYTEIGCDLTNIYVLYVPSNEGFPQRAKLGTTARVIRGSVPSDPVPRDARLMYLAYASACEFPANGPGNFPVINSQIRIEDMKNTKVQFAPAIWERSERSPFCLRSLSYLSNNGNRTNAALENTEFIFTNGLTVLKRFTYSYYSFSGFKSDTVPVAALTYSFEATNFVSLPAEISTVPELTRRTMITDQRFENEGVKTIKVLVTNNVWPTDKQLRETKKYKRTVWKSGTTSTVAIAFILTFAFAVFAVPLIAGHFNRTKNIKKDT